MFEGLFQPMHLLVIFGIALLVFGPKKLPELGKGIGEGIRGFKSAIKAEEDKPATTMSPATDPTMSKVLGLDLDHLRVRVASATATIHREPRYDRPFIERILVKRRRGPHDAE